MVNVVAPGLTDTAMTRRGMPTDADLLARAQSGQLANVFGRPLQPAEVADAVAFLVGPRARAHSVELRSLKKRPNAMPKARWRKIAWRKAGRLQTAGCTPRRMSGW